MKKHVLTILLCAAATIGFGQNAKELVPGYYTILGVYSGAREAYAQKHVETLKNKGVKADYGFNASRDQYLIYVGYFSDLKDCLGDMRAKRKEGFPDAWVRVIPGVIGSTSPQLATNATEKTTEAQATGTATEKKDGYDPEYWQPPIKQYSKMMLSNTEVFLSMYDKANNRIVDGSVQVLNADTKKLIQNVNGNEYLLLPDPKGARKLKLVCEVFGYKKVEYDLDYNNPLADTAKNYVDLMGTTFVVSFNLERVENGQLGTLGRVYFYDASAVMTPDSEYDLNSLLLYMQENPTCRVTLHGHTNGDYVGKITTIGPSKNFFAITPDCITKNGKALELSFERGSVIKEWLVAKGVDAKRVDVKAWGGGKPLYPTKGENAQKNLRVEVEVSMK